MSERSRDTEATLVKKPHALTGYLSVRAQMQVYIVQEVSKTKLNKEVKYMTIGTVARWLDQKGFGFIKGEDGKDIFVHNSDIEGKNSLREGEKVEFEVTEGDKGPRAVKVKSISE